MNNRRRGNSRKIAEKLAENGQESLINGRRGRESKNVDKKKDEALKIDDDFGEAEDTVQTKLTA